jgi:hypothetical protein
MQLRHQRVEQVDELLLLAGEQFDLRVKINH